MTAYDRWKTEPDEPRRVTTCAHCTEDLMEGEEVYLTQDGDYVCVDHFREYAENALGAYKVTLSKGGI